MALAELLRLDALVQIQGADRPGAVQACLALLHVARAYHDEPLALAQLVRMALIRTALETLERLQAQAECTDDELAACQRVLTEDEAVPGLVMLARGERGAHHYFLSSLAAGDVPDMLVLEMLGIKDRAQIPGSRDIRRLHVWLLEHHTRFIAIARQPPEQQPPLLKRLDEQCAAAPLAGTPLFEALTRDPFSDPASARGTMSSGFAAAATRHLAELRCATAALAVARYRLAQGAWPRALAALVPAYLPEAPKDPYDGQPLRYRRTGDGVVVYCLGPDQADNEGKLDRSGALTEGVDIGFQLWEAAGPTRGI
jgi:hypothetical protein